MSPNGTNLDLGGDYLADEPRPWENLDLHVTGSTCGTRTAITADGEVTAGTRCCDVTWTEVTPVRLTAQRHGSGGDDDIHGGFWPHLHLERDSDSSPYYASLAPHRHCNTETGFNDETDARCISTEDGDGNPLVVEPIEVVYA